MLARSGDAPPHATFLDGGWDGAPGVGVLAIAAVLAVVFVLRAAKG